MKKPIFAFSFIVILHFSRAFSQNNLPSQIEKKSVKIEIGHGGLHCPFLSLKFEEKMRSISQCENLTIDKTNSFATFILPADSIFSDENLKKLVIKIGYPEKDVIINSTILN